ncbi:MAG: ATP-binding protein [Deferribacteraceae bacterium]|jgi:signal transduction histidine kinase|nr:ATP-binding protein [Deferribacteraceae bacterium]
MPNAVIDLLNGAFFSPSDELCSFMGREKSELTNLKGWEKERTLLAEQVLKDDRTPRFVDFIKHGKPFHLGIFPLDYQNSEKTHLSVFLFDAEKEIMRKCEQESAFQALSVLASFTRNMLILSDEALILTASPEILTQWKLKIEDVKGKPFIVMLASSDKKRVHEKLLSAPFFSEEITALRGDGVIFYALLTAERKIIKRKLYITVRISIDTLPYEIDEERESEHYLLNIIPSMAAIGTDRDLLYANKEFLDFFSCDDLSEFFNRYGSLDSLFVPRKGYLHSKNGDWLSQAEYYIKNDSMVKLILYSPVRGEYRTFSFTYKKMLNSPKFVFVFIDITDIDSRRFVLQDENLALEQEVERQSHEKEQAALLLKKQEELLVQQSKLATMGNMVNIITHQWKQPLSAMRLLSYNLLEDYKDGLIDNDKLNKYIRETTLQIEYMTETIDDFRNFFLPSKKLVAFDAVEAAESVLRLLKPLISRSGVKLAFQRSENIPKALGVPGELKQVLMGLIINSVEAVAEHQEKENGEISIDISADETDIFILVADNGGGINPDVLSKIFEPNMTTKADKGTGVGLYISKVAMANMKGLISAHNGEKGAIFTLTLKRG